MDAPRRESTIKTKYVCIAVAFTFLILLVVGGFIGGAYLHKSATKDIMKVTVTITTVPIPISAASAEAGSTITSTKYLFNI